MLVDSLKELEAAEDARAGDVTLAEIASRLSEFADEDYALDDRLLGSLKENETRRREGTETPDEDFSIKREVREAIRREGMKETGEFRGSDERE